MDTAGTSREAVLRFGVFRLDPRLGLFRLRDGGRAIPVVLGSRALDVLAALMAGNGELVTKQSLMDAVWHGQAVEDANLTVQISTLRKVLDEGCTTGSSIQTVIGRGYRFLPAVTTEPDVPSLGAVASSAAALGNTQRRDVQAAAEPDSARARLRANHPLLLPLTAVLIVAFLGMGAWISWGMWGNGATTQGAHPRLSLVVLPFQNLSGNPGEDYLADGITDDLTTDLSHIPEAFVIARESAYTYKGKSTDVRQIGRELGVRYVLEGSVRKLGSTLRVNAQLVSAETGVHLWSDRFDEDLNDLAEGQQRVVARMFSGLGIDMVAIESARSRRERPTNPDAFDLILQARALRNLGSTPQRLADALVLFERALLLDPGSAPAMAGVANLLLTPRMSRWYWDDFEVMRRAETLAIQALTIAPMSQVAQAVHLYLLGVQERWKDATVAAQRFVEMFPNEAVGYRVLGFLQVYAGNAEQGIALARKAIQLDPRSPWLNTYYSDIGFAALMLGRDRQTIESHERSLALNPDTPAFWRQNIIRQMAAAYARMGEDIQARRSLAEANRLFPFDTVRGHWPEDATNAVYSQQIRSYQEGLRRAGLRDHADEDADFGFPADADLHQEFAGLTPTTAPGARTIRTGDLVTLLAERKPVVIDLMSYFWGRSIPGAVGLKEAGAGGSLSGPGQDRLRRKVAELTGGDLSRPIVAVGWNSERFDGRNLALRLVAMGYTNVHWYRGGREAWEVNGLPENDMTVIEW